MSCAAAQAARLLTREALCCARLALTSAQPATRPLHASHVQYPATLLHQHPAAHTYSSSTLKGTEARIEEIQRAFADAREEIDLAREVRRQLFSKRTLAAVHLGMRATPRTACFRDVGICETIGVGKRMNMYS